jgi:nitrogen fixation/metabolism regulation signal transduction histidine kinase
LVVGGGIVSILLFLLATASDNSGFFDRYYSWLLGLNAAVAVSLLVLVGVSLVRLYVSYKGGKFGSKLMARLMLLFASVGILPGVVIFLVSAQFLSHSIESWFNVRIEAALESGLSLAQTGLDGALAQLKTDAQRALPELGDKAPADMQGTLDRLLQQNLGMQNAIVVGADGRPLASASAPARVRAPLTPDLPTPTMLTEALPDGSATTEGGSELHEDSKEAGGMQTAAPQMPESNTGLRLRVLMPIPDAAGAPPRYLQLLQAVPSNLAGHAEVLRTAYSEYKERLVARVGLRKMYFTTLTLTLLLAIFGAIASSFLMAGSLAQPLLLLAEGTRAVAEGDLSPRPIVASKDELGTLTQSFNIMTRQLFEARSSVERNRAALQNAKAHLESVLANMSAGVMVLDADFRVVTCNDSVERILEQAGVAMVGQPLARIEGMQVFAGAVINAFSAQSAQTAAGRNLHRLHWQQQIEIPRLAGGPEDQDITLLARGSRLPLETGTGYIVVFDDISDVISAQRSIAWGEVARRLAHEIKNPLTPIQLSAERLQMKLEDKLAPADAELLNRATGTIVNQVAAMKRMVDDFRDYARTPPAVLEPLDLNELVEEILQLYLGGGDGDIIHPVLASGLPAVMGDATQLRQVIHNLLQNAQDAMADRPPGAAHPRIEVTTEAIHYRGADGAVNTAVRLAISDNGPGFAPKILSRAFEPYVTSKSRGTGLGLAMVKKIIDEHGGRIDIQNHVGGSGASIVILLLKLASETTLS